LSIADELRIKRQPVTHTSHSAASLAFVVRVFADAAYAKWLTAQRVEHYNLSLDAGASDDDLGAETAIR